MDGLAISSLSLSLSLSRSLSLVLFLFSPPLRYDIEPSEGTLAGREIIDVNVAIAAPRHRISSSMASNGITRNRGSSSASRGSSNGITNGTTEGGGGGGEAGEEEKDANGGNGPAGETGAGEEMEGVEGVKGKVTTAAFSLAGEAAAVVPTNTNIRRLRTSLLYYSLVYYSLFLVPQMPVEVEVDASDVTAGYESSRRVKFSQDVIPPLSRMVIMVRREGKR